MQIVAQRSPLSLQIGASTRSQAHRRSALKTCSIFTRISNGSSQHLGIASSRARNAEFMMRAASGGTGGGGDGGNTNGDDGNNGDDGEDASEDSGIMWKGWKDRVAADPEFVYKVLVEQIIGVGASVLGDMSSRPNWGLNELDFVFATLVVGSIVNFSLMYLLAPTASAAGSTGFISKFFGDYYMRQWAAPTGHMFEPGFSLGKRAVNLLYKGTVFASIGITAGLVGTAISNGLIIARKKFDPEFVQQNESPNVIANASCWALHMGISSNVRYQMLNGLDMLIQPVIPQSAFRIVTSVVRSANNVIGGMSFVTIAKVLGVQKSGDAGAPEAEQTNDGKKKASKKSK